MRMYIGIYVFVVQMRWIAGWGDLTWMSMDRYGLGGLFWMTGMGGRVEVVRIRIYGIGTMLCIVLWILP